MNQRQRDAFLWKWARSRRIGAGGAALRGLLIGAAGGLLFAVLMLWSMGGEPGGFDKLLDRLRQAAALVGLAVPCLAGLGFAVTRRVYASQERIFQALLDQGAVVPAVPPQLGWSDRGPAIAVGITMLILAGLIVAAFVAFA